MANAEVARGQHRRARGALREDRPSPAPAGAARRWRCPARCRASQQAPIAARASGYLKRWTKDIGSRVEKGELLAEIETPEIDQQLSQAIAARQQTAASLALAKSTVERWEALRKKDVVSQQELDERRSGLTRRRSANLAAADANVERLRQLQGFKRVIAPFAGVITRRNVDVGDLIDAGAARPLFVLTQTDPLRVYVNVPQSYAQLVKPGQKVVVTQAELRGQTLRGRGRAHRRRRSTRRRARCRSRSRCRTATARCCPAPTCRCRCRWRPAAALVVPTNALLFRGEGTRVAVVDAASKVRLRAGHARPQPTASVEVLDGIGASDRLVLNPSDSLAEGDAVAVNAAGRRRAAGAAQPARPARRKALP